MVERRDQGRITRRSRERFSSRTFTSRCASTNGPFFLDRPIYINLLSLPHCPALPNLRGPLRAADSGPDPFTPPLLAPLHDQAVAGLALARLRPQSGLAPRTHRSRHAYRGAPLAAAVRVTGRIHGHPAHRRPPPQPALAAGLADLDRFVLGIPNLPNRRLAVQQDQPHLARGQTQVGEVALLGHDLRAAAGGPHQLPATPGVQLDVVHDGPCRDVAQRQGVARLDLRRRPGGDLLADAQPLGCQDVPLLPVRVVQQGDAGGAVRVVLDRRHLGGHAVLVPLEVDDAVEALVPAAAVPHRHFPLTVPPGGAAQRLGQLPLRPGLGDLVKGRDGHEAPSRRRWFELLHAHDPLASRGCLREALQVDLVSRAQRDDRLPPPPPGPQRSPPQPSRTTPSASRVTPSRGCANRSCTFNVRAVSTVTPRRLSAALTRV